MPLRVPLAIVRLVITIPKIAISLMAVIVALIMVAVNLLHQVRALIPIVGALGRSPKKLIVLKRDHKKELVLVVKKKAKSLIHSVTFGVTQSLLLPQQRQRMAVKPSLANAVALPKQNHINIMNNQRNQKSH